MVELRVQAGPTPPEVRAMYQVYDIVLFFACMLTCLTTATFAPSLGHARWLGKSATGIYMFVSLIAVLCFAARGLPYPELTAASTPWYLRPTFSAGIRAVPWLMPFLLGVVLLRRAGDESESKA